MKAIDDIILFIIDAMNWCEDIYGIIHGWVAPFRYLADPFMWLRDILWEIAKAVWVFDQWLDDLVEQVSSVFSWEYIQERILDWLPFIEQVIDWFTEKQIWLRWAIADWWEGTTVAVRGWIDLATQGLNSLTVAWSNFWIITFPQWTTQLILLASQWGDFVSHKLPTLFDIGTVGEWWRSRVLEVAALIDTSLKEHEPLWAGWQDWKGTVAGFFSDPLEFLWSRFIDWFLGPEE